MAVMTSRLPNREALDHDQAAAVAARGEAELISSRQRHRQKHRVLKRNLR